jgi:hypothetical protein
MPAMMWGPHVVWWLVLKTIPHLSAQVPVSGGGANDSRGLLNEQDAAGDPAAGRGGNVDQDWFMG